ncbi:hypothetical protein TTHERM_00486360 (macronuclear) [Tetrahymena thermophila SB210]|uniref:Kinase domain protein n=1 Tax=Tetrahymena thermophila (strain SB210) TaxID=312017 RepID=I7MCZ1_TETTS|nr:hypothetical protein TTHERM_00486360 [Tetrahymena thermophila SB210]EAR85185.2 hypothetical protein TTHERM_00486360 [Tetrahymena thermophila SB210]|eukprot:XP_001032848.2 hypothetical protein TTHERM_00486360 [Tetrahymena thermophila SB210]
MARVIQKNQELDLIQMNSQKQNYYNRIIWNDNENRKILNSEQHNQMFQLQNQNLQNELPSMNKQPRREYNFRPKIAITNKLPVEFSQNSRNNSVSASNSKEPQHRIGSHDKGGIVLSSRGDSKNIGRSELYLQAIQSDSQLLQASKINEKNQRAFYQFSEQNDINQRQLLKQVESSNSYYVQAQPSSLDQISKARKNPLNQSEGSAAKDHQFENNNNKRQPQSDANFDNSQINNSCSAHKYDQQYNLQFQNMSPDKKFGQKSQFRQLVKCMHNQEVSGNNNQLQQQQNQNQQLEQQNQQQSVDNNNQFNYLHSQQNYNNNNIHSANIYIQPEDPQAQVNLIQREEKNKSKSHLKTNHFNQILNNSNSQQALVYPKGSTQQKDFDFQAHYFDPTKLQQNNQQKSLIQKQQTQVEQQQKPQKYQENFQSYQNLSSQKLSIQNEKKQKNIQSDTNLKQEQSQQYYVMKYASVNKDQQEVKQKNSASDKSISLNSEHSDSQLNIHKRQMQNQESGMQVNSDLYNQYYMKQTASSNGIQNRKSSFRQIQLQNETQISSNRSSNQSNSTEKCNMQKESQQSHHNHIQYRKNQFPQQSPFNSSQNELYKEKKTSPIIIDKISDQDKQNHNKGNMSNRESQRNESDDQQELMKQNQKVRKSFEIYDINQQRYLIKMQKKQNSQINQLDQSKSQSSQNINPQQSSQNQLFQKANLFTNKVTASQPQKQNETYLEQSEQQETMLNNINKTGNTENFKNKKSDLIPSTHFLKKNIQIQSPTHFDLSQKPQSAKETYTKQFKSPIIENSKFSNIKSENEQGNPRSQLTEQEILKIFSQNNKKQEQNYNFFNQKNKHCSDRILSAKTPLNYEASKNQQGEQLIFNFQTSETDNLDTQQKQKSSKLTLLKGVSLQQLKQLSQQNTPSNKNEDFTDNFTSKVQQLEQQQSNQTNQQQNLEEIITNTNIPNHPTSNFYNILDQKSKFSQMRDDSRFQAFKLKIEQFQSQFNLKTNSTNSDMSPVENLIKLSNRGNKKILIQQNYPSHHRNQIQNQQQQQHSHLQQNKQSLSTNSFSSNLQNFKYDIVQKQLQSVQKNMEDCNTPQNKQENSNYYFNNKFQNQLNLSKNQKPSTDEFLDSKAVVVINKKPRSDIIPQSPSINLEKQSCSIIQCNSNYNSPKYHSEKGSFTDLINKQNIQEQNQKSSNENVNFSNNNLSNDSQTYLSNQKLKQRAFSSHNNLSIHSSNKKTSLENSILQQDSSTNKNSFKKKTKSMQSYGNDIVKSEQLENISSHDEINNIQQHNSKSANYFTHIKNLSYKNEDLLTIKQLQEGNSQQINDINQDRSNSIIQQFQNKSFNTQSPNQKLISSQLSKFQNFTNSIYNFKETNLQQLANSNGLNSSQKTDDKQISFRKTVYQLNNNINQQWQNIDSKQTQDEVEVDNTNLNLKNISKTDQQNENQNENQIITSDQNTPKSPKKLLTPLNQQNSSQNNYELSKFNSPDSKILKRNSFTIKQQVFTPQQQSRQRENLDSINIKTGYKHTYSNSQSPLSENFFSKEIQQNSKSKFQIKLNLLDKESSKLFTNFFANQHKTQVHQNSKSELNVNKLPNSARNFESDNQIQLNKIRINELITVKQISNHIKKVVHVPSLNVYILRSIEINSQNRTIMTQKIADYKSLSEKYPFLLNQIVQVFYNTPESHISILSEYQPLQSLKKVTNCFCTINERSLQQIVIELLTKLQNVDEKEYQHIHINFDNILFDKQAHVKIDCSSREKQTHQKDELLKILKKISIKSQQEDSNQDTKRSSYSKQSSTATSFQNSNVLSQKDNKNDKNTNKHHSLPVSLAILLMEAAIGEDILYDYSSFQFSSFASQDLKKETEYCCFLHSILNKENILYNDQQSLLIKKMLTLQYTTNFIDFLCQCFQNVSINKLSNHLFVKEATNQKFTSINELIPISLKYESEQEVDSQKRLDQILSSLSDSIPNFSSSLHTMKVAKQSLKESHPFVDMLQKDLGLAAWNILSQLKKAYDLSLAI